jgi:hypothetical protein
VSFLTKIELKDRTVYCKELKVKHLKTIYKCLLGDSIDSDSLLINLNEILKSLTAISIQEMDFVDFFILLIHLRCSSIGSIINIQISENTNLELNLYKFIEKLDSIPKDQLLSEDKFEKFCIRYKLPSILEVLKINNDQEKIYNYFIKEVSINDQKFIIENENQSEEILKILPVKNSTLIFKKIRNVVSQFNNVDLLDYNKQIDQQLFFNFNIKNLSSLIKILFGDHLLALYENIFGLCKLGNFTPDYIENCTPGEYILFVKKLQETNKQESQQPLEPSYQEEESSFDESLNPYESGDLPPITSQFSG